MSDRRIVLPGHVLAVSRRTTRRYHLFMPGLGGASETIFWYCLTIAANKTGVVVVPSVDPYTLERVVVRNSRP